MCVLSLPLRAKLLGLSLLAVFIGCAGTRNVQRNPAVVAGARGDTTTVIVRAALARALSIQDSLIWPRIVFREDTAWAMVTVDSLMAHRARLERRSGLWVFVRFDGSAVR